METTGLLCRGGGPIKDGGGYYGLHSSSFPSDFPLVCPPPPGGTCLLSTLLWCHGKVPNAMEVRSHEGVRGKQWMDEGLWSLGFDGGRTREALREHRPLPSSFLYIVWFTPKTTLCIFMWGEQVVQHLLLLWWRRVMPLFMQYSYFESQLYWKTTKNTSSS